MAVITAGCNIIPVPYAALSGLVAGVVVVGSCVLIDRIRIDDPVGAISVHGVCGVWGTLAVGLFAKDAGLVFGHGAGQLGIQAIGVLAAFAWAFPLSLGIFLAIKYTVGLRVSAEEEIEGLDLSEHGVYAYPPSFVTGVTGVASVSGTAPAPALSTKPAIETA